VWLHPEHRRPALRDSFWWSDHAMRWSAPLYMPRDADPAPAAPPPGLVAGSTTYPVADGPVMFVVVGGTWRRCRVQTRHHYGGSRVAFGVRIPLQDGGTVFRSVWWHPESMYPELPPDPDGRVRDPVRAEAARADQLRRLLTDDRDA
jgi:hypothetical protein